MDWIVITEADSPGGVLDVTKVEALLGSLTEFDAVGLYSADRYAVQVVVPVDGPAEAVGAAIELVRTAARRVGLPDHVVRAQAMTPGELAGEVAASEGDVATLAPVGDELASVHEATRALVRATTRRQVIEVIVRLVQRLGGRVDVHVPGHRGAFRLGLELVPDEPLTAYADDDDTWLRLAEALPAVIDDARVVLQRLEAGAVSRR